METTATSKGQIVIPSAIRRKMKIEEGTRFSVTLDETAGTIVLHPITEDFIKQRSGSLRGKGLLHALKNEKKRDSERH